MGGQAWSADAMQNLKQTRSTQTMQQIFKNSKMPADMDPRGVQFRESRDSTTHPNSVAIMLMLDVTGSMGKIPELLVREKFGTLMETLIAHGVPDAQVLFGGIGDHYTDDAPLQIGQFEAGTLELDQWLHKLWLEGGGGGQAKESYSLAWLFAARHTSIDCFEKRKQKGFLFTVGDEGFHERLEAAKLTELLGYPINEDLNSVQLLREANRIYHTFHLHVNEGSYKNDQDILGQWHKALGERVLVIDDYNTIAEVVATTVAVMLGADLKNVVSGFDDHTAKLVTNALVKVSKDVATQNDGILKL